MPKTKPLFEVKASTFSIDEEIRRYVASLNFPENSTESVPSNSKYASALEDEGINYYITRIFNKVEEVLCYKKDGTFIGTRSVSCSVFRHRPNPNYRKRRYKTKCRVSKDILWVIVGAKEDTFPVVKSMIPIPTIIPGQRYLVPVLHKRRKRIYKNF